MWFFTKLFKNRKAGITLTQDKKQDCTTVPCPKWEVDKIKIIETPIYNKKFVSPLLEEIKKRTLELTQENWYNPYKSIINIDIKSRLNNTGTHIIYKLTLTYKWQEKQYTILEENNYTQDKEDLDNLIWINKEIYKQWKNFDTLLSFFIYVLERLSINIKEPVFLRILFNSKDLQNLNSLSKEELKKIIHI